MSSASSGTPPHVRTVTLLAWPADEISRLEDRAWGAYTPRPEDERADLTVVVEFLDEGSDATVVAASWCGMEGPLPTVVGLIDGALAGRIEAKTLAGWSHLRIGRVAVVRGDPFGSAPSRALEDEEEVDLFSLTGEDRAFALALIHSEHTDSELREALRWGRRATIYGPDTVLGEFAAGSGTLAWRAAIRAALTVRRKQGV